MTVYLGKDRKHVTPSMTATHANVAGLAARIGHVRHKLYMGNFFSSPASSDDLNTKTINCCGAVTQKGNGFRRILEKK